MKQDDNTQILLLRFAFRILLVLPMMIMTRAAVALSSSPNKKLTIPSSASRLVIVSGASRGVGLGICRQVLQRDPSAHVLVTARHYPQAETVCASFNADDNEIPRAHPFSLDVTDPASCESLVEALQSSSNIDPTLPLVLVCNAGIALDLPWFPTPWKPEAAQQTLEVNLHGSHRLTEQCLPLLLQERRRDVGRVIFISSGGGRNNMKRMSEARRHELLRHDLTWKDIDKLAQEFVSEYEAAARVAMDDNEANNRQQLPHLSSTGFWLQSYGFSKAALGSYCQILHRLYSPKLLSVACSPGFIATDMSKTYANYDDLKSIDEGGQIVAWLATTEANNLQGGTYYTPDQESVSWVADS